jgi:rRNA-processing protein FCF1
VGLAIRPGIDFAAAAKALNALVTEAENHAAGGAGVSWPDYLRHYLVWVETAEQQLRNVFADSGVRTALYTERHWQIRAMTNPKLRPFVLVQHELRDQIDRLCGLRGQLIRLAERMRAAPGVLAVLDTHVLLHYLPVDQVDWRSVTSTSPLRLVVPLRVVEELDEKKYTARDDKIASRARDVISRLRMSLLPVAGNPVTLAPDVTIEIPLTDEPRRKTSDADEEVLETCLELQAAGGDVVLVTGDAGLAIRAAALSVPSLDMPAKYARRRLPEDEYSTFLDRRG